MVMWPEINWDGECGRETDGPLMATGRQTDNERQMETEE